MPSDARVISSIKEPAVAEARRSLRPSPRGRTGPRCFLADGRSLVGQAVEAHAPVEAVFVLAECGDPRTRRTVERAARAGVACHRVSRGVFFRILDLGYETSADVLAVVRRPRGRGDLRVHKGFCALVGERIQDPRNVGVLVRTADAMGLSAAVFSADSADPYSRPAVRSTTGSIFRLPPASAADLPAYLHALKGRGVRIVGSSASAGRTCPRATLRSPCAVVVGNESVGLSAATAAACDEIVAIPMGGRAHSLNVTVAAGILLYEWARRNTSPPRRG